MEMNLALTRAVGFFSFHSRRKSSESGKIRKSEAWTFPDFSFLCTSLTYQFTHVQYFLTPL